MARPSALHDEASWRLPDWESDARDSDAESDASSVRVPRSPPMASTTSLTATRRLPLQVQDLRALHLRFAKERQEAAGEQTTAIATQLESVREQLREFQQQWQATAEAASATPATLAATSDALRFDMAVQTDVVFNDNALRQWLYLITQKMEVLTISFHGDTTQLPLKYPLQSQLDRPVSFPSTLAGAETEPIASWHVGGSLKTLVGESTAERLLDLERAVACLATATRETTTRYVEYFEKIVVQIQDLHQQRLRQVVDESLEEMKTQRARHKRRVEQLEAECRATREELSRYRQTQVSSIEVDAASKAGEEEVARTREAEWSRERQLLLGEAELLKSQLDEMRDSNHESSAREDDLRDQLKKMAQMLEAAQSQAREAAADEKSKFEEFSRVELLQRNEIDRLEKAQSHLRAELLQTQRLHQTKLDEVVASNSRMLRETVETANARRKHELEEQQQRFRTEIDDLERKWHAKMAEAEETKRLVSSTTLVDQGVQTEDDQLEEVSTNQRIARLKRRCKALENLLDKKFEDSSVASVGSVESGLSDRWSLRSENRRAHDSSGDVRSRTLPLTLSLESSLDDTYASSNPADTPSRVEARRLHHEVWEAGSHRSNPRAAPIHAGPSVDPDAPSAESMMVLVRKLEAFASSSQSGRQPDEEPAFSDISTPTQQSPLPSRPTSAAQQNHGWTPKTKVRSPGAVSAPMRSLRDPRRLNPGGNRATETTHLQTKVPTKGGTRPPPTRFSSK